MDIVHAFDAPGAIGPKASLIQADDGNFYGVTERGGLDDCGTIFRMTPSGVVTVIHAFNCTEGKGPRLPLVQAQDGYLYGTVPVPNSAGAIVFGTTLDGAYQPILFLERSPSTALVEGSDGSLYGGTNPGGLFRITPSGDVVEDDIPGGGVTLLTAGPAGTILGAYTEPCCPNPPAPIGRRTTLFAIAADGPFFFHSVEYQNCAFCIPPDAPPGLNPIALVMTPTALFGVDADGNGSGTAFRKDTNGFTVLHQFGFADPVGRRPVGLTLGPDGNLYGATGTGGQFNGGSLFRMTPDGVMTLLHSFDPAVEGGLTGSLVQAADGTLVGLTNSGVVAGTAFATSTAGDFTIRHRFADEHGARPNYLIRASDDLLYGTTARGGLGFGVLFRLTSGGSTEVLKEFPFNDPASSAVPGGADTAPTLMAAADGAFYGTTFNGSNHHGTLFRATSTGEYAELASFHGSSTGTRPAAPVLQAADGAFYGTTLSSEVGTIGTVYRFAAGEGLTSVHRLERDTEGWFPAAALVEGTDGFLYGTTAAGGSGGLGTIFRMTTAGLTTALHSFQGAADGAGSVAPLIQASDGHFYGTAFNGGAADLGTVFRLTSTGTFELLHAFAGADGANPSAGLVQAADGNLYGVTQSGGAHGRGAVFRLTTAGVFTLLHSFDGANGERPSRRLVQGADGFLYGTAERGGPGGGGVIFRLIGVSCVNTLTLDYAGGTLDMGFHLRSTMPTAWSTWLVGAFGVLPMWSVPIPAIDPEVSFNQPIPGFPRIGPVGVITVMSNPEVQALCYDWKVVDTGQQ